MNENICSLVQLRRKEIELKKHNQLRKEEEGKTGGGC